MRKLVGAIALVAVLGLVSFFGYTKLGADVTKATSTVVKSTTTKLSKEADALWSNIPPYTKDDPLVGSTKK